MRLMLKTRFPLDASLFPGDSSFDGPKTKPESLGITSGSGGRSRGCVDVSGDAAGVGGGASGIVPVSGVSTFEGGVSGVTCTALSPGSGAASGGVEAPFGTDTACSGALDSPGSLVAGPNTNPGIFLKGAGMVSPVSFVD